MILKECFNDDFIESKAGTNIEKKKIYEKVVHAFYLLEKLSNLKLDFVINKFEYAEFIRCAVLVYILCIKILYSDEFTDIEKPKNCFVGRRYKLVNMCIGEELYEYLMKAIYVENSKVLKEEVS